MYLIEIPLKKTQYSVQKPFYTFGLRIAYQSEEVTFVKITKPYVLLCYKF